MRKIYFKTILAIGGLVMLNSCKDEVYRPELPAPEGEQMATGKSLDSNVLFGVWQGMTSVGSTQQDYFEQNYKLEFLSVEDGEAFLTHWYPDAETNVELSKDEVGYTYTFDGTTVKLTPTLAAKSAGATEITGVHVGDNRMKLYTTNNGLTNLVCELTRTGDPEPAVTGVNRTLPHVGETVTITGRNMQFVNHLWIPTTSGEKELTDFTADSRQISFTMPSLDTAPGFIRCESEGAHTSSYTPAMFCDNCVFFHNFSSDGGSSPNYEGTEFENSIGISQSLFDKAAVYEYANLPAGHSLTLPGAPSINPDTFLSFFAETPQAWPVDTSLDPDGYLRFSFGDMIHRVIEKSDGMVTAQTKCSNAAIEMDLYVYTNGEPVWNTGFISFRLDKDAQKSLTQQWFAQTAMWDASTPVSFEDGWLTWRIPLSEFTVTSSDQYSTLGQLANYLINNEKQALIKFLNYPLDAMHPAIGLDSFQINIADMRLVPTTVPEN